MQIEFIDVLTSVFSLIVLIIPGFLFAKLKMLPEKATEALSTIVLYGCQTMMVFMSFQAYSYTAEIGKNMLIVAGLATAVHLIMVGIMCLVVKSNDNKAKVIKYGSVFGNCGFMGIPFLQTLFYGSNYASEILIYCAVVISVFNVLSWTVGVYLITNDVKQISIKKIVLNPVIIAVVVGALLFFIVKEPLVNLCGSGTSMYKFVSKIMSSLKSIGDAVTPLSMIVIGIRLAKVSFKELFTNTKGYTCALFKLVGESFLAILIVVFLPVSSAVKYTIFLLLSMPCATSTSLLAVNFGGDGDFGSVCVLLSTILSVITIPLMFLVFNGLFGVAI